MAACLLTSVSGWFGFVGALLFVLAWYAIFRGRSIERENWLLRRAPQLPLALVNSRDDVWLRGETRCAQPLYVPHFEVACLHFRYQVEERVDQGGKSGWKVAATSSYTTDFALYEGDRQISVSAQLAEFRDLPGIGPELSVDGDTRHRASYLPYPGPVSVLGCVSDQAMFISSHENIPLIISSRERDELLERAGRKEEAMRLCGLAGIFLGTAGMTLHRAENHGPLSWLAWLHSIAPLFQAALAGTFAFLCLWSILTYNRMARLRRDALASWRHIDVDLKQRYDLIPNLCAVARQGAAFENELLDELLRLRQQGIGANRDGRIENEAVLRDGLVRWRLVSEDSPEVTAHPLFRKLERELTAIEDKIAHDRMFFNDCVERYNTFIQQFPRNLMASVFGFHSWPLFRPLDRQPIVGPAAAAVARTSRPRPVGTFPA